MNIRSFSRYFHAYRPCLSKPLPSDVNKKYTHIRNKSTEKGSLFRHAHIFPAKRLEYAVEILLGLLARSFLRRKDRLI